MSQQLKAVVFTDGECEFCKSSLRWIEQKLDLTAFNYQDADLESFGLSLAQCEKAIYVIYDSRTYVGAQAIALLLKLRGNLLISKFINFTGPLGRFGYRWVAAHRSGLLVKIVKRGLDLSNTKADKNRHRR